MTTTIPDIVFDNRFVFELQNGLLRIGGKTDKISHNERAFIRQHIQTIHQFMLILNTSMTAYQRLKN